MRGLLSKRSVLGAVISQLLERFIWGIIVLLDLENRYFMISTAKFPRLRPSVEELKLIAM